MNDLFTFLQRKAVFWRKKKDIELIFQCGVTKQGHFVLHGLEFKATINIRANPIFHMPELKTCKRHVKTHNAYLKPLPQNHYLHF